MWLDPQNHPQPPVTSGGGPGALAEFASEIDMRAKVSMGLPKVRCTSRLVFSSSGIWGGELEARTHPN